MSSDEAVACNLCGADTGDCVATERGLAIVRCRGCGLVYVTPRPCAAELALLYAGYHARNGEDEASWDRLMGRIFCEVADLLCATREGTDHPRLLDVGCGFGGFVELMRRRGWDAEGVDPSSSAVEVATRHGRRIRLGTLEQFAGDQGAYDAVTLFYVLEHLTDPMAALRKVFNLLAAGGAVVIRVPHTTPLLRLLAPVGLGGGLFDAPYHLFDFSPAVLWEMLDRAGFADVRTFPGQPTVPSRVGPRLAAAVCGAAARWLHAMTQGVVLLPGVSKTTLARKPSR